MTVALAIPEWTEHSKKRGLDPLGMQNSSIDLYQRLLPGIGNVTNRIRYYGIYSWLAWVFAHRIGSTDPERWRIFIRRAEALYALIAMDSGNEKGMAGVEWAQKKLANQPVGTIDFVAATDPNGNDNYFDQAWGVYGLAYRSQLIQIGILDPSSEHATPITSKASGEPLAQALSEEHGAALEAFFSFIEIGKVPREKLQSMASLLPSAIPTNSKERGLYENILFSRIHSEGLYSQDRSNSLLQILSISRHLKALPRHDEVRWALYAGCERNGEKIAQKNEALRQSQVSWKIYHANDLLHFSYAALLRCILDFLVNHPEGLRLPELITALVTNVADEIGNKEQTWENFVDKIGMSNNAWAASETLNELNLSRAIDAATKRNNISTTEVALQALHLLAILHQRMRKEFTLDILKEKFGNLNSLGFRSLLTEYLFLEEVNDMSLPKMLARFFEERIIKRHLWVANKKFLYQGDYTFLIEIENGRIKRRATDWPVFTNPRLTPAITFLKDIHLIDENGLTLLGLKVCEAQ